MSIDYDPSMSAAQQEAVDRARQSRDRIYVRLVAAACLVEESVCLVRGHALTGAFARDADEYLSVAGELRAAGARVRSELSACQAQPVTDRRKRRDMP